MLAAEAEVARATEGRRIPPPPPPRSTSRCRKGSSRPRRARCRLRAKSYYAAAEACRVTGKEQWPVGRVEEDSGGGGRWVVPRRTLEAAGGASRGGLQHLSLSHLSDITGSEDSGGLWHHQDCAAGNERRRGRHWKKWEWSTATSPPRFRRHALFLIRIRRHAAPPWSPPASTAPPRLLPSPSSPPQRLVSPHHVAPATLEGRKRERD